MSQKAVTSVSFSIKKKEPIRVVKKNSLEEQTTKKSTGLSTKHLEGESSVKSVQNISPTDDQKESAKKIENDAIEEILRDTKRGATRAEISGSWLPPSSKINARLFKNTLVQTLQSNSRKQRSKQKPKPKTS